MDMKKLIESMDRIEECGMTEMPGEMPPAPVDQGNPVTVNVSMNASGKDNVADLLKMMQHAGLGDAEPVSAKTLAPRLDMERLRGIVDGPEESIEEGGLKNMSISVREDLHDLAQEIQTGMPSYDAVVDELNDMFDAVKTAGDPVAINAFKTLRSLEPEDFGEGEGGGPNRASIVAQDAMDMIDGEDDSDYDHLEGYANAPDEEYGDIEDVTASGDDLHKSKKGYKAAAGGDNPMSFEAEIKERLMAALQEKKKPDANKNGIPDYAEDGKGKNDLAKGSKPKKGKVPPQFQKK